MKFLCTRIAPVSLLVLILLILTGAVSLTQQRGKVYRIGFLFAGNSAAVIGRVKAFRDALEERGYVEGKNIAIETRYGEGKLDRVPTLATELVNLKVDVIVTGGLTAHRAAKDAPTTGPMVM